MSTVEQQMLVPLSLPATASFTYTKRLATGINPNRQGASKHNNGTCLQEYQRNQNI